MIGIWEFGFGIWDSVEVSVQRKRHSQVRKARLPRAPDLRMLLGFEIYSTAGQKIKRI